MTKKALRAILFKRIDYVDRNRINSDPETLLALAEAVKALVQLEGTDEETDSEECTDE